MSAGEPAGHNSGPAIALPEITPPAELKAMLQRGLVREFAVPVLVESFERLSGGASRETWSFDALPEAAARLPLIWRRDPGSQPKQSLFAGVETIGVSREAEFDLLSAAGAGGVPVPRVRFRLPMAEGGGFVMDRVAGETNPRRILREPAYAAARARLAADCGRAAARIHRIGRERLPSLQYFGPLEQMRLYRNLLDQFGESLPTFELALRWLERRLPEPVSPTLVHGDFRHGNIIVDERGLAAVLDWELAHLGDPMEDLGWLCVKSWRFGGRPPVGGFGTREELFAAYEAASGIRVDPARVHFWEVFGSLKWGEICLMQAFTHLLGRNRSVELAAIGRRVSETEFDLLNLLAEEA